MSDVAPPARGIPLSLAQHQPTAAPPREGQSQAEIRQAAEQFESMFLDEMMGPMFEGLDTDGLGGGGIGEEMFRPMLIEQYAKALTHAGGIGLADSLVREITRMQGAAAPPAAPSEDEQGTPDARHQR